MGLDGIKTIGLFSSRCVCVSVWQQAFVMTVSLTGKHRVADCGRSSANRSNILFQLILNTPMKFLGECLRFMNFMKYQQETVLIKNYSKVCIRIER